MLGCGHISHFSEYVLSSTLSIYSTLIAIVFRDYDAAFRYHSWFSFILWWGCWYTNMSPLTRSQCKVSDTQVTVKACGPLVLECKVGKSKISWLVICIDEKQIISHVHINYTFSVVLYIPCLCNNNVHNIL